MYVFESINIDDFEDGSILLSISILICVLDDGESLYRHDGNGYLLSSTDSVLINRLMMDTSIAQHLSPFS